jgi:hypothetical protein
MKNESTTAALDLISQTAFLTTLSTKLEARRTLLQDLGIELPTDLTLHCESCSHALNSIKARKMPFPPELYKVFPEWDAKYFPEETDSKLCNEICSLYKNGNSIEYLSDLFDMSDLHIIDYIHSNNE